MFLDDRNDRSKRPADVDYEVLVHARWLSYHAPRFQLATQARRNQSYRIQASAIDSYSCSYSYSYRYLRYNIATSEHSVVPYSAVILYLHPCFTRRAFFLLSGDSDAPAQQRPLFFQSSLPLHVS